MLLPFLEAVAMSTIFLTFGVILGKNGMLTACRTQRQILVTTFGF